MRCARHFAKISAMEVRPNELPGHTEELSQAMNEALTKKWTELRGIAVVSIAMNPITLPEEDAQMIKEAQRTAIMRDPAMAAATLVGAQAEAMKSAAENKNGAMMGFMGMGMAQQAGGVNAAEPVCHGTAESGGGIRLIPGLGLFLRRCKQRKVLLAVRQTKAGRGWMDMFMRCGEQRKLLRGMRQAEAGNNRLELLLRRCE